MSRSAELDGESCSERRDHPASREQRTLRHFFRIPAASERVPDWHVAPAVDMIAYHFSWLWLLAPLLLFGDRHTVDYFALFVVLMASSLAGRTRC